MTGSSEPSRFSTTSSNGALAYPNPHGVAIARRCEGLLLAARGEVAGAIESMDAALAGHAQRPLPLETGRTLLEKGSIERRAKRKTAAKQTLEHALALLEPLGAAFWVARARDEFTRIGLRRAFVTDGLTPAQERVAELAVGGATNREIARDALHERSLGRVAPHQDLQRAQNSLARATRRRARRPPLDGHRRQHPGQRRRAGPNPERRSAESALDAATSAQASGSGGNSPDLVLITTCRDQTYTELGAPLRNRRPLNGSTPLSGRDPRGAQRCSGDRAYVGPSPRAASQMDENQLSSWRAGEDCWTAPALRKSMHFDADTAWTQCCYARRRSGPGEGALSLQADEAVLPTLQTSPAIWRASTIAERQSHACRWPRACSCIEAAAAQA